VIIMIDDGQAANGPRGRAADMPAEALVLPPPPTAAWREAEACAQALIRTQTGSDLDGHLTRNMQERPGLQLLAVGIGGGALAIELAARQSADATILCIDSAPEWISASQQRADELGVKAQFTIGDFEDLHLDGQMFDLVFCHAALHRVIAIEALIDCLRRALRPGGELIVVDVLAREDYYLWPETREVARAIWNTLPAKYRLNHTGHAVPLIDDVIWEPNGGAGGAAPSRTEKIAPALDRVFHRDVFVPYFALSRRFFDAMYGPNYDLSEPLDRAIFDWVWQLDLHYVSSGQLRPETFFGIYRLPR
jgi:ubiquinone/menaquinone biosynthesis C-methylase UbiE